MSFLRALLFFSLAVVLGAPASATWSIVVLNRATGEVAVATSTCLSGFSIKRFVPVLRVGVGAGASQSFVIPSGINKVRIFENLPRGATPQQILDYIESLDNGFQSRQFGIVSIHGDAASHTGTANGGAALGVVGEVGDWSYSIQGNVLTGGPVIYECEATFLNTPGDLATKMMAAMEAARDWGGDGRCSCTTGGPTNCGTPPINGFTHASYNVYMGIARLGDLDGVCNGNIGCVNGDYYFDFNYIGTAQTPEPIGELRLAYEAWRAGLAGRPDHILSEVTSSLPVLRADGSSTSTVTVRLVDVEGVPLVVGGQTVSVFREGDDVATIGAVVDNADGTHSFDLTSTGTVGDARFTIVVDDGIRSVQLHPPLDVAAIAPAELHLGAAALSVSEGTRLPMILDRGAADAGASYRVLGSASGTSPGTSVMGTAVALNPDRFFRFTLGWTGGPPFVDSFGALDTSGRALPELDLPAGVLAPMVGSSLAFTALIGGSDTTNVVSLPIVP